MRYDVLGLPFVYYTFNNTQFQAGKLLSFFNHSTFVYGLQNSLQLMFLLMFITINEVIANIVFINYKTLYLKRTKILFYKIWFCASFIRRMKHKPESHVSTLTEKGPIYQ